MPEGLSQDDKNSFAINLNKLNSQTLPKTDYVLIDLASIKEKIFKIIFKNSEILITKNKVVDYIEKNSSFFQDMTLQNLQLSENEELSLFQNFINFIKANYKDNQIILLKTLPTKKLIDDVNKQFLNLGHGATFELSKKLNHFYFLFEKSFTNLKIIEMPNNALGYVQHDKGFDNFHFVDDVYEYLLKSLESVIINHDSTTLAELKKHYESVLNLIEKQKLYEFWYCKNKPKNSNMIQNPKFTFDDKYTLPNWTTKLSSGSNFTTNKCLSCGNHDSPWAILSQNLNLENFANQYVTLSIKYKTFKNSKLNVSLKTKNKEDKFIYIASREFINNNISIDSFTTKLPAEKELCDCVELNIFVNKPDASAILFEIKVELGEAGSLFK